MSRRRDTHGASMRKRVAASVGAAAVLAFCLGCMSLNFGGKTEVVQSDDGTGSQCGKIQLAAYEELTVYYPVPYYSPPNLQLDTGCEHFRITDQRADHFKVKNVNGLTREVSWKARGMKSLPPGTIIPTNGTVIPVAATIVSESQPDDAKKKATLTAEPIPTP